MTTMAVRKISISLSEDVAAAASRFAEIEGVSLSTWLNNAAERAIRLSEGRAALLEDFAENGEPSDEARAWARDTLAALRTGDTES